MECKVWSCDCILIESEIKLSCSCTSIRNVLREKFGFCNLQPSNLVLKWICNYYRKYFLQNTKSILSVLTIRWKDFISVCKKLFSEFSFHLCCWLHDKNECFFSWTNHQRHLWTVLIQETNSMKLWFWKMPDFSNHKIPIQVIFHFLKRNSIKCGIPCATKTQKTFEAEIFDVQLCVIH